MMTDSGEFTHFIQDHKFTYRQKSKCNSESMTIVCREGHLPDKYETLVKRYWIFLMTF